MNGSLTVWLAGTDQLPSALPLITTGSVSRAAATGESGSFLALEAGGTKAPMTKAAIASRADRRRRIQAASARRPKGFTPIGYSDLMRDPLRGCWTNGRWTG